MEINCVVVRVNYEGNTIYNAVYTDYIGDNHLTSKWKCKRRFRLF
ncbi:hypothetical protein [Enterococcus faecalis]